MYSIVTFIHSAQNLVYVEIVNIGRSVRSTTASVIQIPTTTPPPTTPIIPKKIMKP